MNVAGISAWGTVENLEHRHWQRMVDVNLMGPIHVIESFVPAMMRGAVAAGALVNVSSAAGLLALPWHAAYSASKYGLRGVSEVLRFDLHTARDQRAPRGSRRGEARRWCRNVEVVGVDWDDPRIQRLRAHASRSVPYRPRRSAKAILPASRRTGSWSTRRNDIRFGYWWARKFAPPYEFVMQKANDRFSRFLPPA